MDYQIILLPSLASEGSLMFYGWYNDAECTNPLESFEVDEDKTLYSRFEENTNNYTITFDTRKEGVSVAPITAQFGAVVQLPSESIREHCSIAWWETEYGDNMGFSLTMPAHNFVLYAVWKCTHITSLDDFIDFSKVVNSGTDDYAGVTVYLDSDLSLAGETLEPIGKDSINYFHGVFDGQGHIISDLKMNSSSIYAGLFGYSYGLIIKSVVLDSSCSVISSYIGTNDVYMGGITGNCYASRGECNIENSVSMAGVTFSGDTSSSNLYLGGIVGYLSSSSSYTACVKNCANYGSVVHTGTSKYSDIGGIAGYLYGLNSKYKYIQNCLNYGAITHSGTTSNKLYLGGIAGNSYYTYIENCVSAGKISTQTTPKYGSYIGSIVGYADSYTSINYCYCTSELSRYKMYRYAFSTPSTSYALSYNSTTFELNETVSVGNYTGTSLISALNAASDYYFLRGYSKWLLNKEKKGVNFTINSRTSHITMDCQIILLPSLASEGSLMFYGWYNDAECTNPLESFEVDEDKTLYSRFEENTNNYTTTFDTRREGVFVAPITAQFGTTVSLPSESSRDHCSVGFWENEYDENVGLSLTMPARNFTLYAVWKCTHIKTPDDFIDFSKVVNSGADNYSGTTVLLGSDLSLSGKSIEPIGKNANDYFRGTFDGQGYIISDLKINSTSPYAGLFGYSNGLSIRNVVTDSSCSMTSSYSGSSTVYIGGIISSCSASIGECNVENSVNMADVTFNGNIGSGNLHLGGIVGYLFSSSCTAYVKNCANNGSVTHSGVSSYSHIGGIVGYLDGSSYKYLYNCLKYGTITHSGTTSFLYLGGIVGHSSYAYIENCVNAGKVSTQNTPSSSYIGSIMGDVDANTSINYCYYTSDVGDYNVNGTGTPMNTTGTPDSPTSVDLTLISELNDHRSSNGWNKWLFNVKNETISFIINNRKGLNLSSQLFLLPDPLDGWRSFAGWFSDSTYTTSFSSSSISDSTTLYGRWDKYVVKFDANGGNELSVTSIIVSFSGTYDDLPETNRTGYTFIGWFTDSDANVTSETIFNTPHDHTLYAHWSANDYTVTFDVNGGNELAENKKTVIFDSEYGELPKATKEGYMFLGWFTNKTDGTAVTSETKVNTPNNYILYAKFTANSYTVILNASNSDKPSETTIIVTFNNTYGTLPEAEKLGYMFLGWFTEKANGTKVTRETTVTIPNNHTLYAHWEEITNQVEIVFNSKNLTREDVEKIVQEHVDEGTEFTVVEISTDETGETKVIIKFTETEEAENFIINIKKSSEVDVKKVSFVLNDGSFSSKFYPTLLLVVLLSI